MKAPTVMCLGACFASVVAAIPLTFRDVPSNVHLLEEDDLILYNAEGRMEIVKKGDFAPLHESLPTSPVDVEKRSLTTEHAADLVKRDDSTIIVEDPAIDFLGWDIQMSSMVQMKEVNGSVNVMSGYMAASSVTTGISADFKLIEDFLSMTYSRSYTETWTSVGQTTLLFPVPAGHYGTVVSNPWTHRESGHVFKGRIGSAGSWGYYQADSFRNKTYGEGLQWVDGVITVCTGTEYPLPRCRGEGVLT